MADLPLHCKAFSERDPDCYVLYPQDILLHKGPTTVPCDVQDGRCETIALVKALFGHV